jgi:DNA-damage-inducible protein J
MSSHTTVQVRMDTKTKHAFRRVVENVGLDMSTAFNVFAKKVIATKGIPFEVRTENGFTPAQERDMIRETQWALKHGKRYTNVDDMFADILGKEAYEASLQR